MFSSQLNTAGDSIGSDQLDLIRRLEEEFSIYLPDDELREIFTVGNLYNLLLRKLKPTPDCSTSKAFYRIRRAITAVLGLPRHSIGPGTFLDDLFSEKQIREQWGEIGRESGLKLPNLRHTAVWRHWLETSSAFISIGIIVVLMRVLFLYSPSSIDNFLTFLVFGAIGLILWGILYTALLKATYFRRTVLPVLTAGELARVILSMNAAELLREEIGSPELTNDQVWIKLVDVFCDQMAFKRDDVVPSASIVGDLGVS
jgi:hypothetical protein